MYTCDQLISTGLHNIRATVSRCLEAAAAANAPHGKTKGSKMGNPGRVIRLIRAVIEGGNEPSATRLGQSVALTIDVTCSAIVTHLDNCKKVGGKKGPEIGSDGNLTPAAVLKLLSENDGVGASMLGLLVEQVFVLPLNAEQMVSVALWDFLTKVAAPCMDVRLVDKYLRDALQLSSQPYSLAGHIKERYYVGRRIGDLC
jgi:hypothetical protein